MRGSELSAHEMARPALQRPSMEALVANEVEEYVECQMRWWGCQWDQAQQRCCWWLAVEDVSRFGKVIWRPGGLSVGAGGGDGGGGDHAVRVPAVLLVHVSGGAPDSVQFRVPDVPVACSNGYSFGGRRSCEPQ